MNLDGRRVALAMALVPGLLFADALGGRVVFYERDIFAYWVPAIDGFVRAVAEGAWPLWDPLTNFGRPMLADPNFQFAYPPTWLNLVLPAGLYYSLFVVAHCAWAGIGGLRLGRAWGLGPAGAAWAGVLWMLSGPFVSLASLFHHFASAAWMAWVLLALEHVLSRPSRRSAGWLAAAAAGMALAGSADVCLMTGAAAVARAAVAVARKDERAIAPLARRGAALAAAALVAALIAGVQWLPTLSYLAAGTRGSAGPVASMYWSAHPASLLDAIFPRLVGDLPLGAAWRLALFEGRGPLLRSLYVGLPALALAILAFAGRWRLRWLAVGLAASFLLAGLGRFTPVYPAIVELPIVRLLRFPVKMLVPAALFLSLLSGAGVDVLVAGEASGRRRRFLLACALGLAVAGGLALGAAAGATRIAAAIGPDLAANATDVAARLRLVTARSGLVAAVAAAVLGLHALRRLPAARTAAVVMALAVIDLMAAARGTVRLAPAALMRSRPALLAAFAHPEQHRLYYFDYGFGWLNEHFTRVPAGWDPDWAWALGYMESLAPPISGRWGIAGSFDGDFTGLTPVALGRLIADLYYARDEAAKMRLLRIGSVTDAVSFEDALFGSPPRAEAMSVYSQPVRVFAVPDPLPRAYVVSGVRADGPPEAPSIVTSATFDERREVALDATSGRPPAPPADDAGRARIVARRADRLTVAVTAHRPAVLVVTESYDPGWRAWVDGRPAPVWRANAIFRGVAVPEGDHSVEMRYRPPSVAWGAAASVCGVALAGLLIGRRRA